MRPLSEARKTSSGGPFTRRPLWRGGGSLGAVAPGAYARGPLWDAASAFARTIRAPGELPDRRRPAGTPTSALPFDHIVIVMMENHSFDNLLGAIAHSGQPKAQGLKFSRAGV